MPQEIHKENKGGHKLVQIRKLVEQFAMLKQKSTDPDLKQDQAI